MITGNTVKAELGQHTGSTKQTTGERTTVPQLPDNIQTLRECTNRNNKSQERSTVHQHTDLWRNNRQKTYNQSLPTSRTSTNRGGGSVV